ncbi:MAG: tetratricopeptide repeat protein, partial [Desulfonatronovibrio sp.]
IPGARAYYEAGRIEEAQNLYQQALQIDSLEAEALIGLGLWRYFGKITRPRMDIFARLLLVLISIPWQRC